MPSPSAPERSTSDRLLDADGPTSLLDEPSRRAFSTSLLDDAVATIRGGANQYPPGRGVPALREAAATHQQHWYDLQVDPDAEVLVTAGATEAITATSWPSASPATR